MCTTLTIKGIVVKPLIRNETYGNRINWIISWVIQRSDNKIFEFSVNIRDYDEANNLVNELKRMEEERLSN